MAQRDPFQNTPDVSAYVARPATEEALASLLSAVRSGERLVALEGPAGIGKTLLGHVLAEQCRAEFQIVRVPVPSLPPEGLYGWVLATIGISAGAEPRRRLIDEAQKASDGGHPLFVSVDDAGSLPDDTAIALRELHAEIGTSLRVLFTIGEDAASARLLELLGPDVIRVRLDETMSSAETAVYLHARLAHCEASQDDRTRFDPEAIEQLHRDSSGLPSAVNELADELMRPEEAARTRGLDSDLRPETLAFALLTEAEEEQRMTDEELVRVVASRGSARADSAVPAPPRPGRGHAAAEAMRAPMANAAQSGSNALLGTARPIASVERPEAPRTPGFAKFLQTLTPDLVAGTDSNPLEEIESLVEARMRADAENDRVAARGSLPELPELPARNQSGGLANSILSALADPFDSAGELRTDSDHEVEASDENADTEIEVTASGGPEEIVVAESPEPIESVDRVRDALRPSVEQAPESEAAPAMRPPSNPIADRILGALRNPPIAAPEGAIAPDVTDGARLIREVLHVDVDRAAASTAPQASADAVTTEPTTLDASMSHQLLNFEPEAFEPFDEACFEDAAPADVAQPVEAVVEDGDPVADVAHAENALASLDAQAVSAEAEETFEPAADVEAPTTLRDTASFLVNRREPVGPVELPELSEDADGFEPGGYDFSCPPPALPSFEVPASRGRYEVPPATTRAVEGSLLLPEQREAAPPSQDAAAAEGDATTFGEESVLLPYVPPPTYMGSDSILLDSSPPAPRGRVVAQRGASDDDGITLADLAPGNASLRSLGVFDGGRSSEQYPKHSGLTSSQPMAELAGEIAREAEARRGMRTEILALAAGIALFAAGTLVYWAATPPTIVRAPTIQAPAGLIAEAGDTAVVGESGAAAEPAVEVAEAAEITPAAANPVVAAAPAETPNLAPATGLSFWPPLETDTAAVVAEAAPVSQASEPTAAPTASPLGEPAVAESSAAEAVEPAETVAALTPTAAAVDASAAAAPTAVREEVLEVATIEPAVAEDVLEVAPLEVATAGLSGAIAGQRPPAAIAAPEIGARVLPVTVRAPAGMVIEVDGVERGVAPMFGLLLSEGTHRVVLTQPGGEPNEQLFEVDDSNLEVLFDSPSSR